MRAINSASVSYTPIPPNGNTEQWAYQELKKVQAVIQLLAAGHIDKIHVLPDRPRDGDIRYCDGTDLDLGTGTGIYYFNGTSWTKLG